jgi:hypothetical protein
MLLLDFGMSSGIARYCDQLCKKQRILSSIDILSLLTCTIISVRFDVHKALVHRSLSYYDLTEVKLLVCLRFDKWYRYRIRKPGQPSANFGSKQT